MVFGPIEHEAIIRFRNMDDFERFINAIDVDYDSEDFTFAGYVFILNTPHFNRVLKAQYGRGTDFKQDIVEYHGQNCFIPTSGIRFFKFI